MARDAGRRGKRLWGRLGGVRGRLYELAFRLGRLPSELPDMSLDEMLEADAVLAGIEEREEEMAALTARAVVKMLSMMG